jgi:hypothetical protein
MKQAQAWQPVQNQKLFRAFSYALLFLMLVCVVMAIGALLQRLVPEWRTGLITGLLLLVAIDRLITYRSLKKLAPLSLEWVIALGAQLVLMVVVFWLILSYARGPDSFKADLLNFTRGNFAELFSPEYLFTLILSFLAWYLTGHFMGLLDEIGLDQELVLIEERPPLPGDIVSSHERLANLVFSIGAALVVLTVLTRLNIETILSGIQISQFSGAEAGTLLYFVFGLTLLSLSRLMSLQLRWHRQHIRISSSNLVGQWGKYSLLFLLLLGLVVSLLPAGEGFGLLSLVRAVVGFLSSVLFFFGQLLLMLISLAFSLPLLLLRRETAPTEESTPEFPSFSNLPVQPAPPAAPNETWLAIRPFLIWGLLAVITIYALTLFVRQHGGVIPALRSLRFTNWLVQAWGWLARKLNETGQNLAQAVTEGWNGVISRLEGKKVASPARLIRLGALDARRQVYFFYLAMIRRGGEQGLVRKPSQTPAEYALTLDKALPEAKEDVESLTQAYVEARYSRKDVDTKQASFVKSTWARLRRALQAQGRRDRS